MTTKELEDLIAHYDKQYYQNNKSDISDAEYDALKAKLASMGIDVDSIVPDGISSAFAKVEHTQPILSLAKVNTKEELKAEITRLFPVVVQHKMDGLTIVLYPDGRFVTRGRHGLIGEDVTHTCRKALPQIQFVHSKYPVRMEVFMDVVSFSSINRKRVKCGQEPFENRRNAAAGILRQKDAANVERLSYFAYNLVGDERSESEQLAELKECGFDTVPSWTYSDPNMIDALVEDIVDFNEHTNGRKSLGYDIDGMVIKSNRTNAFNIFGGATGHHPKNMCAFKWAAEQVDSVLKSVELQVGRTGKITPVAIFDTIRLGDSDVSRASLHNFGIISALGLKIGATIGVIKANEIIPRIVCSDGGTEPINPPTRCPVCSGQVTLQNDQHFCMNPECYAKVLYNLAHAASKDALDINGLSEETIRSMVDQLGVRNLNDLMQTSYEDILTLERFAEKSARNLCEAIQSALTPLLNKFIYAAGIPNVGRKASDDISAELSTYEAFIEDLNQGCKRIREIPGIGDVIVDALIQNKQVWVRMREVLSPRSVARLKAVSKAYTFVITGTLSQPRSYYENIIKAAGHKCSGSISSKTDYLLAGDKAGSKLTKANELGVKVIDELTFNKMSEEWK